MLIQVMQRTDKTTSEIHYLVDKEASDKIGYWTTDVRFAQICDSEYDSWEFQNEDRRSKVYNFTYNLIEVEAEIFYIISDPRGWVVLDDSLPRKISYSKTNCSIITGGEFGIFGFAEQIKTRIFPFG